jgi:hypothetical protein
VFLKRCVREVLLQSDEDNIQMLKCFSLHNTLRGLMLLINKVTRKLFTVKTVVLASETGDVVKETDGFDFECLD